MSTMMPTLVNNSKLNVWKTIQSAPIHSYIEQFIGGERKCKSTGVDLIDMHNAVANLLENTKSTPDVPVHRFVRWVAVHKTKKILDNFLMSSGGGIIVRAEPSEFFLRYLLFVDAEGNPYTYFPHLDKWGSEHYGDESGGLLTLEDFVDAFKVEMVETGNGPCLKETVQKGYARKVAESLTHTILREVGGDYEAVREWCANYIEKQRVNGTLGVNTLEVPSFYWGGIEDYLKDKR